MRVSFELPAELESELRGRGADLGAAAREAYLVSLYRQGVISRQKLSLGLGVDRIGVEAVLKRHEVTEDLGTAPEYAQDMDVLRKLRDQSVRSGS